MLLSAILPLSLGALMAWTDPEHGTGVVTSTLKFKAVKEWDRILPQERWTKIDKWLPIPQNNLPGFSVDNSPNTLAVDTNADGKPDKNVRGIGDFLTLKGKLPDGGRFPYAVRIRAAGDTWQFASSCIMTGKILGESVTLYDLNNNNIWNEIGTDGISLGNTDCVSYLSRVLNLKGSLYQVKFSKDGGECSAQPFTGPAGTVSVSKGYESKGNLVSAVFRSRNGDYSFDLADAKKGMLVPTGTYQLESGLVRKKKASARIRRGSMKSFQVASGATKELEWGGPIRMEFKERPGKTKEEVLVYPPKFFGQQGEEYYSFAPLQVAPTIFVNDERGKEIWSGKFCSS